MVFKVFLDTLLIDLEADQAALERSTQAPLELPPLTTELDFTPVNGLRMLQREFGSDGFDALYSVMLRKHNHDSVKAAADIRQKDLCSCFLSAKMQLTDYNIESEPHRSVLKC